MWQICPSLLWNTNNKHMHLTIKDFICKLRKKYIWLSERYFIADKYELDKAA